MKMNKEFLYRNLLLILSNSDQINNLVNKILLYYQY